VTVVPTRPDQLFGLVAAVVVVAGTAAATTIQPVARSSDALAVGLMLLAGLSLGWRRIAPFVVLTLVVAATAGYLLLGYPYGPIQLCLVVAMFEVARLRNLRLSAAACAGAVLLIVVAQLSRTVVHADQPIALAAVWASWLLVPWSVGALIQARYAAARRNRRELVARAAWEERIRIAQEVHDIAGHGLSAVAMQAGVALVVFDESPEQAKESLEAIRSTSTAALGELRHLLDALQPTAPITVTGLVDTVRAAGLQVNLTDTGGELPAEGYRVLQEALTNVLRHAGPTAVDVILRREPGGSVVEVLDRGVGAPELHPGRGLTGMQNRVAAVGGTLDAGNRPDGGFRIFARIPDGGRG
jgi:signal transduction histidine kinase